MAKQYDIVVRLILVGDSSVGKTSMICRFAEESLDLPLGTTVGEYNTVQLPLSLLALPKVFIDC